MAQDRITSLLIQGLRSIHELDLDLDGLTVLVGENGSGKSSIVEALELCRRMASENFWSDFSRVHGGLNGLLGHGEQRLSFTVGAELLDPEVPARGCIYSAFFAPSQHGVACIEFFDVKSSDNEDYQRIFLGFGGEVHVWNGQELAPLPQAKRLKLRQDGPLSLVELSGPLAPHPAISRMRELLASIEVHLPFEVTPSWAARAHQRPSAARGSVTLQPAERLDCFGSNLANVFFTLRNEYGREHWEETMDFVRLGLGGHVESVNTRADPAGGSIALALKLVGRDALLPAYALSDGQLAYLSFVALYRLQRGRSLLAFDEPELHMHPELLARVVQFFEDMAKTHPVIIATHSDVVLDALSEPAKSIRVCELEDGQTRLKRLDEPELRKWLERYRGVGHLRSEGYLSPLLRDVPPVVSRDVEPEAEPE